MKSEAIETDRIKIESRQSIHRRKMSKNSSIVNGADESLSYVAEDESVVRKINLAAAFHDHISCTKSAELCKIDGTREARVSLPCETDHIYANCSDMKNKSSAASAPNNSPSSSKELSAENNRLRSVIYAQLELIKRLEEEIEAKNNEILNQKQETNSLRARLEHKDRMCQIRKRTYKSGKESADISDTKEETFAVNDSVIASTSSNNISSVCTATPSASTTSTNSTLTSPVTNEHSNNISSVNLVTRYFGRRSKTIPSRALKRRYLGPPKNVPSKKVEPKSLSSATSVSSESETHEDEEMVPKPEVSKDTKPICENTTLIDIKKVNKKRGKKPKGITRKMMDFLTTDKAYFLPDNQISTSSLVCSETLIDVPSWKLKPVTSFYQMEGTENINDSVFQRRHLKCEQDERRRKRWDIQRLREQKASEKLKYKYSRESGKDSENGVQHKSQSFYPDPRHIQYIEVTDQLPVLAFGHLIPLFQPSEFSISWEREEKQSNEPTESHPVKMAKKVRLSSSGPKVT